MLVASLGTPILLRMRSSPAAYPTWQLVLCIAALCIGGCSSFDRDYDAAATTRPVGPTDITGRWHGIWQSDASGHNGDLRCLVTRLNRNVYHARYAAVFLSIFHFEYEMNLTAAQQGQWVQFNGDADLGAMAGGVYHYEGHADSIGFFATYQCTGDRGRFTLKRP